MGLTIWFLFSFLSLSRTQGTLLSEDNFMILPIKVTYLDAVAACKSKGLIVVRIEDEASNQLVHNFATVNGLGTYWIDGMYRLFEDKWVYNDRGNITYSKWYEGRKKNKGYANCIHGSFFNNSYWNEISCDSVNAVICYGEPPVSFNEGQLVIIPGRRNYWHAFNECKARGYNLVKIQTEKMNELVYNFATKNKLRRYWIEGNEVKGHWVFEDGKRLNYSKWIYMNHLFQKCISVPSYRNGIWMAMNCHATTSVICYTEQIFSLLNERQLVSFPNMMTYVDATRLCNLHRYYLVKIYSEDINKMVYDFAMNVGIRKYWIDGNDIEEEGHWVYEDEMDLVFKKWRQNEPNNFFSENCIHILEKSNGFWNDINCRDINGVICYKELNSGEFSYRLPHRRRK